MAKDKECINLEYLNLSCNKITRIQGLGTLEKLRMLYLDGNQIPKNIIEELGGFNYFEARDPRNFVKYCQQHSGMEL